MIVILMGAPGAGKGTQAEYLKAKGFQKIATGDLLRKEIASKTDLGKQVEEIVNSGGLPSDQILMKIVAKELEASKSHNLVFDGFPRTVPQAEWLSKQARIAGVIHIDTDRAELLSRISGRLVCGGCGSVYHVVRKAPQVEGVCDKCGTALKIREDDTEERLLHRLDVYTAQTSPVLDFYKNTEQYFRIDGNCDENAVSKQIEVLINKLAF